MAMVINAPPIWPKNMMEIIEVIVKLPNTCPEAPLFKIEMNREAAKSNFHALRKFNFDLEKALAIALLHISYSLNIYTIYCHRVTMSSKLLVPNFFRYTV